MSLFDSGIRPIIDEYLLEESKKVRNYGEFWSASSAGYCMRRNIFERLGVPHVETDSDARKQRVFEAGHIFHSWIQGLTKDAGISIAQELELEDTSLMIRGHIDDLVLIDEIVGIEELPNDRDPTANRIPLPKHKQHLILMDYKTAHSRSFHFAKDRPISHYHKMQLGTYMYMLRHGFTSPQGFKLAKYVEKLEDLTEARILSISKDDLCLAEKQLLWSDKLEKEIVDYWTELNKYWNEGKMPPCTCDKWENGFLATEKYNPYFYEGKPCSLAWIDLKEIKFDKKGEA